MALGHTHTVTHLTCVESQGSLLYLHKLKQAGRVVLPLLLWWVIGYELQLVFGVFCEFGWLLKVKSIDVFWLLYASWWIPFCVLAFPQTLAISSIYALMCRASAHVLWHLAQLPDLPFPKPPKR